MPIRLSGLNSGLDTDAIVKELVNAYSLKTQKYEKQKTKLEWKQDAWKTLNTKIYGLYTNVSNLRRTSAYNLKKTSVSDATKAKVTASSGAVAGTQKLQIVSTAQASYITGGKLGADVTSSSTLAALGYSGGDTTIEVRTKGGDVKEINLSNDTKISDIVKQLQDAGMNASFDETNKRFFISSKESGEANDFDLCATDANSQAALSKLGLNISIVEYVTHEDGTKEKVFSSAGGYYKEAYDLYNTANGDIDTYLRTLVADYKTNLAEQEAIVADNKDAIDAYKALEVKRDAREAHENMVKAFEDAGYELTDEQVYALVKEFGEGLIDGERVQEYLEENGIDIPSDKSAANVAALLSKSKENIKKVNAYEGGVLALTMDGVNAEIESAQASYDAAMNATNAANAEIEKIKASEFAELVELDDTALTAKIAEYETRAQEAMDVLANSEPTESGAIKIEGQDAKIVLNGAEFTSNTNTFSVNGLTIEALAETTSDISITTAVDTDGIYDKIKDFLTEYNSVINEMTKLYNADSARDYEPLTDEEKEAMSESEIEKWEDKIKASLLRRDSSLSNVMSAMINSMSQSIEINGKKVSLSTFGISTQGFLNAAENEQNAYHIDGDEDDAVTSGKTDKLRAAIQEDPDQVIEFMKQLTTNLYESIDAKMKSTTMSSAYKVYNDKAMDTEMRELEELIAKWEDKVSREEEYYYKKFSDMEVALSKLQSQTNSLTGLLGQ